MAAPLLPLAAELIATHTVKLDALDLMASTYAIAIGFSSRTRLFVGICIFIALVFAVAYGLAVGGHSDTGRRLWPMLAIAFVFVFHVPERYNRHVADREPFWEFARSRSER